MVEKNAKLTSRPVISWALYDWANSAFATTVIAGFFPLFFKHYWSTHLSVTESTAWLGIISSAIGLIVALSAPILGTISDLISRGKEFLFVLTLFGCAGTAGLAFVGQGHWGFAAGLFAVASFGFTGALTFYDSLLVNIAPKGRLDEVSALGYALGYLGGGLLFTLDVLMYLFPSRFGLAGPIAGVKASFVSVALWWIVFTLPLMFWVKEPRHSRPQTTGILSSTLRQLKEQARLVLSNRQIILFLIAYFCYIDGVNTIVKMAVDFGMSIGLKPKDLIVALLLVQFISFPAALFFGWFGRRKGPLQGLWICLLVYAGITLFATQMTSSRQFYLLAATLGLVQGGIQSLSRSFYARVVPEEHAAQYFGFFNLLGKFSTILGPLLVGLMALWSGDSRRSLLVLWILFLAGGVFLWLSRGKNDPMENL